MTTTPNRQAVLVGYGEPTNLPQVDPLRNISSAGQMSSPFVVELSPLAAPLRFGSYLGDLSARAVATDGKGNVYITGDTTSPNLPTVRAVQSEPAGQASNAFVMEIHVGPSG